MTVEITATFSKTTTSEGFQTYVEIINAVGIGMDVLVFKVEDDSFSHVATVFDYETYPASKDAAAAMNLVYYRSRALTRIDSAIVGAAEFETITRGRLKSLAVAWDDAANDFEGSETITFDSTTTS